MKILNHSKKTQIADTCRIAKNFFPRFMGLMGKKNLSEGSCLIITPCNSIHMFFMKIPLDIIFIDKNSKVLHIIESIKPWRISKIIRNSHSVIELPVGTLSKSKTTIGDQLIIE